MAPARTPQHYVWLASYPRSGNTFLRTILFHCFGLKSGSVYPMDVSDDLVPYVGHIEHKDRKIDFADQLPMLVKTHTMPMDDRRTIYVVRDGRPASVSLWDFYGRQGSLEKIIRGENRFGTWSNHLTQWKPQMRPNTLLIRYEELARDIGSFVPTLADFLGVEPIATTIPPRSQIASADGRWVRPPSDWRTSLGGRDMDLFLEINGQTMKEYGYL